MPGYWDKDILVLGCGNILFGDDGFGPEVVGYFLEKYETPARTGIINAGLSVREILFNIALSERRPGTIIIVDAVDAGRAAGEVFELDVSDIPAKKIDNFSMHQMPTSNLLRELKENCGVEVKLICAQVRTIPEEVSPGLSEELKAAIPPVCDKILQALA